MLEYFFFSSEKMQGHKKRSSSSKEDGPSAPKQLHLEDSSQEESEDPLVTLSSPITTSNDTSTHQTLVTDTPLSDKPPNKEPTSVVEEMVCESTPVVGVVGMTEEEPVLAPDSNSANLVSDATDNSDGAIDNDNGNVDQSTVHEVVTTTCNVAEDCSNENLSEEIDSIVSGCTSHVSINSVSDPGHVTIAKTTDGTKSDEMVPIPEGRVFLGTGGDHTVSNEHNSPSSHSIRTSDTSKDDLNSDGNCSLKDQQNTSSLALHDHSYSQFMSTSSKALSFVAGNDLPLFGNATPTESQDLFPLSVAMETTETNTNESMQLSSVSKCGTGLAETDSSMVEKHVMYDENIISPATADVVVGNTAVDDATTVDCSILLGASNPSTSCIQRTSGKVDTFIGRLNEMMLELAQPSFMEQFDRENLDTVLANCLTLIRAIHFNKE